MKLNLNLLSVIGVIIFACPLVFAQDASKADDVTKTINEEIRLTQEHTKNVMNQIGQSTTNPYADSAYEALAKDFKTKVDRALAKYESDMKNVFLPKVQYWLARFASSSQLSGNSNYVQDEKKLTNEQLASLHDEYISMIMNLYSEVLGDVPMLDFQEVPLDRQEKIAYYNVTEKILSESYDRDGKRIAVFKFSTGKTLLIPEATISSYEIRTQSLWRDSYREEDEEFKAGRRDLNVALLQSMALKYYDYGCTTLSCQKLRGADFDQFILLVSHLIDKPMVFIVSGSSFKIEGAGIKPVRWLTGEITN